MNSLMFVPFMFVFVLLAVAIAVFVFWIVMLVDALQRRFKGKNEKLLWVLVLIFASWIGAIIYYFLVYNKK
ncbi:hypothetical protein COV15_00650 [Candidatus Woesearchaeota archaeon CG10_big_fil_rev_8_21_14_0_10_34_12]|nr:MAG: hypothetical protein COV15_00650 [Candidatus Woesearchaeota archaeon CG10_big_fil_rev_8_21_14_0_10_34_12]